MKGFKISRISFSWTWSKEGPQPPSSPTKRATIAPCILYIIPEMPAKLNAQTSVYIHTNNTQSHIISASVINCSITNFVPENSTFLISKSVGRQSRSSLLGPLLRGLSQAAVKVSLGAVFSPQGLTGHRCAFMPTHLLAECCSLWITELIPSVSCWLLDGGYPQFPATDDSPEGNAQPSSRVHQSKRGSKIDVCYLTWYNHGSDTRSPLLHSVCWKEVTSPTYTEREGITLGMSTRKQR